MLEDIEAADGVKTPAQKPRLEQKRTDRGFPPAVPFARVFFRSPTGVLNARH
jgi:hypothetical protein